VGPDISQVVEQLTQRPPDDHKCDRIGEQWGIDTITDADDPRLDDYRDLRDAVLRRSRETAHGIYCLEGRFAIERALASGRPVKSILVNATKARAMADVLEGLAVLTAPVPVLCASSAVLEQVTGFDVHRGALAIGERWALPPVRTVLDGARLVVALEDLVDTENVGAIFRTAAALGADGVILSPGCADPLWRRAIRVSQATVLTLPWTVASSWPSGLFDVEGAEIVALDVGENTKPLASLQPLPPTQCRVLVLGSEGPGISAAMAQRAHHRITIPICHDIDSLNVAAAAAIAIHHCIALPA
jgi:tRNA G18 (ribose-2'-O)-methylase SpoU